MDITQISNIRDLSSVSRYGSTVQQNGKAEGTSFDTLLNSAMGLIGETNELSNKVEEEEIRYAMGESSSLHDLQVAQQKANVSLQYTVAVKNTVVEAYKSLLNMQF